jgi:uncharacterized membrane protein YphA (DoxX/SURF4 family)
MSSTLDPLNRGAVRWGLGLGVALVVAGLVLRPVAVGVAVIAFLAALMCLGVAGYAWVDDRLEARQLRRRAGRR